MPERTRCKFVPHILPAGSNQVQLGCDSVNDIPCWKDMREFWEDSWAWLAERGVNLYETSYEEVHGIFGSRWLNPSTPVNTAKSLPWAVCVRKEFMPSKPILCMVCTTPVVYAKKLTHSVDRDGRSTGF